MSSKVFKKADGFIEKDFLHFGYDHIDTGMEILKGGKDWQFDSAGYLIQLGIELVLKALHLKFFNEFRGKHDLVELNKKLPLPLTKKNLNTLEYINKFSNLRYPKIRDPVEIGQDDLLGIEALLEHLWEILPDDLKAEYYELDPNRKEGRVLMQR